MKKIVLLMHGDADVAALPKVVEVLTAIRPERIWAIVSPAIVVSSASAEGKIDEQIAALEKHKAQAKERDDFIAAQKFKEQQDGLKLDRAKAVNDAWKALSPEESKAKFSELLAPVQAKLDSAGIKTKFSKTLDHYPVEQWNNMVNSFLNGWDKTFPHGSYTVAWARDVATWTIGSAQYKGPTITRPTQAKKPQSGLLTKKKLDAILSKEQLDSMRYFGLMNLAKKFGVWEDGQKKNVTIQRILDTQKPAEPVAA